MWLLLGYSQVLLRVNTYLKQRREKEFSKHAMH